MPDVTFARHDLTKFCRLDDLGLEVVGQHLEPDRAVLACRVLDADEGSEGWCRRCGCQGAPRDTVTRRLAHVPMGWRPTTLLVSIRRYRCTGCGHVAPRHQPGSRAPGIADPHRPAVGTGRDRGPTPHHRSGRRGSRGRVDTVNDAVLAEGRRVLIDDEQRFDGVTIIGVGEHVWCHTRRGDKDVTVIIDLTPVREGTGPARLLDMVEGRSKQAFKTWLAERPEAWREAVEVVAMDGFTGFKTAAEEVPDAVAVMDPLHVVRLAGDPTLRRGQSAAQGFVPQLPAIASSGEGLGRVIKPHSRP